MRKLNRVIAAGALAVPMALGASGIAMADVADVADDSSGLQDVVGAGDSSDESGSGDTSVGETARSFFGVGDDEGSDQVSSEGDTAAASGKELREDALTFGEELRAGDEGNSENMADLFEILGGNFEDNGGNPGGLN